MVSGADAIRSEDDAVDAVAVAVVDVSAADVVIGEGGLAAVSAARL